MHIYYLCPQTCQCVFSVATLVICKAALITAAENVEVLIPTIDCCLASACWCQSLQSVTVNPVYICSAHRSNAEIAFGGFHFPL